MPKFDIPLIMTVEADSYEEAFQEADFVRKSLLADGYTADHADLEYDNEDQRVVYLHPETKSKAEW